MMARGRRPSARRRPMGRFSHRNTLESCDDGFQPSVDRKKLQDLATGRCLDHGEHIVFLGPPGAGNTHLAIGLGLKSGPAGAPERC